MIGIRRRCRKSPAAAALAATLLIALAGCGGDEEGEEETATQAQTETQTETSTEATETEATSTADTEAAPPPTAEDPPATAPSGDPEDQPGGAGDEEPARSLALFTGVGGRIIPQVIRVPAFISIRVELRSSDGAEYGLTFRGETIRAGDVLSSASTTLDGLRPGRSVTGKPTGASNRVRIEATAEPGP
jgi:hypothetical protein